MIKDYDIIIIGAGISGLKCAHSLSNKFNIEKSRILIIEAQDYVGGRVKQTCDFIPGCKIDLGAEFIHGDNSMLNEFAEDTNQPLEKIFCWAHGDGGPSEASVEEGYGLYFINADDNSSPRLLRFDDNSPDFKALNRNLWDLSHLDLNSIDESLSVYDYLKSFGTSDDMIALASAGFANTMATNLEELSLKQSAHWAKEEHYDKTHSSNSPLIKEKLSNCSHNAEESSRLRSGSLTEIIGHGDYRFKNSYSCLIDYLREGQNIIISSPVSLIDYSSEDDDKVIVHTKKGDIYQAKRVVVTCSPIVLKNPNLLQFQPSLPPEKVDALDCISMYTATKVILTFKTRPWPRGLHGIIMAGTLVPEVWFKEDYPNINLKKSSSKESPSDDSCSDDSNDPERSVVYMAVGFLSARFANEANNLENEELIQKFLAQLDYVFSHFTIEHVSAVKPDIENSQSGHVFGFEKNVSIIPSQHFVKGIVYDWATNHPYIGGSYASPKAGKPIDYPHILAKPIGRTLFFAGEATNVDAGACTHSALETGLRAAEEIAASIL